MQALSEIPMEGLYFYCETFDVTRAFAHAGDDVACPVGLRRHCSGPGHRRNVCSWSTSTHSPRFQPLSRWTLL
jgi:hypothetical protein